jgi:F-type H+-transporting ATPase subunit delta
MAQDVEKGLDVADVYAAALYALAAEQGAVDTVRGELEELVRLVETNPAFGAFLGSVAIDPDDRERSLEKSLRGRLSDLALNTLLVMNRHGRAELLRPLWRAFVLRVEDARGQIEVVATSAVELDADQRTEIERTAERLSGKKPLVEFRVNPHVLGGLVLQVGDWRYDYSLRRQLDVLRRRLLERTVAQRGE